MLVSHVIDSNWSKYDQTVGESQLQNYNVIFLDAFRLPIDDIYETEELFKVYKCFRGDNRGRRYAVK